MVRKANYGIYNKKIIFFDKVQNFLFALKTK